MGCNKETEQKSKIEILSSKYNDLSFRFQTSKTSQEYIENAILLRSSKDFQIVHKISESSIDSPFPVKETFIERWIHIKQNGKELVVIKEKLNEENKASFYSGKFTSAEWGSLLNKNKTSIHIAVVFYKNVAFEKAAPYSSFITMFSKTFNIENKTLDGTEGREL